MSLTSIGIVGSGMMGRGIAEAAALGGLSTVLIKVTPGDLDHDGSEATAISRALSARWRSFTALSVQPTTERANRSTIAAR